MNVFDKAGVLLRDPQKLLHYCKYSSSRLFCGQGVATIPLGGRIRTSSFSEYLSVYGLMLTGGELGMMRNYLASAKEVFDLGANVGVWTVLMNKANPQARIHSFEPNPNTHALLEKNVELNHCANVCLNLAAVSNTTGQITLQVPRYAAIYGRVAPVADGIDVEGRFANANSFTVPCLRLVEYCQTYSICQIDFLKIDVEGHELAALSGLEPLLSERRVKAIYIETIKENQDHMGNRFSELLEFLDRCGYRFHTVSAAGAPGPAIAIADIKADNHLCLPC